MIKIGQMVLKGVSSVHNTTKTIVLGKKIEVFDNQSKTTVFVVSDLGSTQNLQFLAKNHGFGPWLCPFCNHEV